MVGATIRLNGSPFTVVGVADPRFQGTDSGIPTNVWVPVMMKPMITADLGRAGERALRWFYLFGRLEPGVSTRAGQASLRCCTGSARRRS